MNFRNWVRFYFHTLLIGIGIGVVTGFAVRWNDYKHLFYNLEFSEIGMTTLWLMGIGAIFATLSQMGYFAYLTVHRFGLGFFRSLWNPVQVVVIAFVLFDLVYLRYNAFANEGESIWAYVLIALFLFLIGTVIAYLKAKQSNDRKTFIPALFFMVCATILEWVPVLRTNAQDWFYLMLIPLLVCNAYQLLSLPKYLEQSKKERMELKKRKEQEAIAK